jgi:predicted deacylase
MPDARDAFMLGDTIVLPGETRHMRLAVSESYVSTQIEIPLTIINGMAEGPIVYVCAASHGDECNGTGIARELVYGVDHSSLRGVLVVAPVLNLPGFLRNERDLPDGRDLNRNFPGKPDGNSAQRMADAIFTKMVQKCDYGLDLHTATRGRSNILQVRGDMSNNEVRRIARAFGSEIVIDEPGLAGTLRRAATESGIPTITAEIGESQRFEKELVKAGLDGVLNVLFELGMLKGKPVQPRFQVIVKKTEWVRANKGGILEMIAEPRGLVFEGDELCTITNPFGKEVGTVRAPFTGMVVGITNYPMVSPGSPICHLVKLDRTLSTVEAALRREKEAKAKGLKDRPDEKPASEAAKPPPEGASPGSAAPPADASGQVLAPQPVIISPPITKMLEEKDETDDRPLKPEKEAPPQKKARKAPAEPALIARRDEPAESSSNGERESDVRPSAYYEDYDEDAEPEEKE